MAQRRIRIIAFLLSLGFFLMPYCAKAASTDKAVEPISFEKDCALTITYSYYETCFSDVVVNLYKVADVSTDLLYTLTPDFSSSGIVLNGVQASSEWNIIRSTLEAYIFADSVDVCNTSATNQLGQVSFNHLSPGLYIAVIASPSQQLNCTFDSVLVSLPELEHNGLWQYELSVKPKSEVIPPAGSDEITELKILKLWKGDNNNSRPENIEVEIYRNGTSYKTVTLSEKNHWSYSWNAKKYGANWSIIEKNIPSGYVMTVEKRTNSFVITNEYNPDVPVITDPVSEYVPDVSTPSSDTGEVSVTESSTPSQLPSDAPQTGDTSNILFYIILMNISGILLIISGITGKRNQDEK